MRIESTLSSDVTDADIAARGGTLREVSIEVFQPLLFNEMICFRWRESPDDHVEILPDIVYSFDLVTMTVPQGLYRVQHLNSNDFIVKMIDMPVRDASGNPGVEARQIMMIENLVEIGPEPSLGGSAQKLRMTTERDHACDHPNPQPTGANTGPLISRDRGGGKDPCGRATRAVLGSKAYVAGLYKFSEAYQYQGKTESAVNRRYHDLFARFNGVEARMVCLTIPNGDKVWIPIPEESLEKLHAHLEGPAASPNASFVITDLGFLDGPDILTGACDFVL